MIKTNTDRLGTGCVKWDGLSKRFGADDLLALWVADMDFEVAPQITEAIQNRLSHKVFGYTAVSEGYYDSISGWLFKRHGFSVAKEEILPLAGVVPSLFIAVAALTAERDTIVVQPPVYPPFFSAVQKNNRRLALSPLRCYNGRYEMDFANLEAHFKSGAKLLLLCSPQNPTGRVFSKSELLELASLSARYGVVVVSDEIHSDIVFKESRHIPFASLSDEAAALTVTLNAPSKSFNLAGLYSSFAVIKNEELRKKFLKECEKTHFGTQNIFGQLASIAAYSEAEGWLDEALVFLQSNRDYCYEYLKANCKNIAVYKPEGTYLLWLDFRATGMPHAEIKSRLINDAKLALNDGETFGEGGSGFFRLNFATSRELLEEAMQRLEKAFR